MFAYCGNSPIIYRDESGTRRVPNLTGIDAASTSPAPPPVVPEDVPEPSIMDEWAEKGVIYKSNENGNGGRIINSYLITDYDVICEYAYYLVNLSEYSDDFVGSAEGVAYEWDIHNKIYYYGPNVWKGNAKDVDLGATIFDDPHRWLNSVMWEGYRFKYPRQYDDDQVLYIIKSNGGVAK